MTEKAMAMGVVLQMVQQNDDKAEAAHTRLRLDHREIEKRVMALERAYTDIQLAFTRVDSAVKAPVDAMRLTLSTKQVAAIVVVCCGFMGGLWSMNYQLQDLKQQQAMVRAKVEGLERSVATLMGRTEKEK